MNIVAIDTTSGIASVAARSREGRLQKLHSEQKMSHLQNLIPMIESLLKQSELQIDDISHIAISEGPGSFTGIRIGAATAKMLARALQIDLIPVPTLVAYAYGAKDFDGIICPMLDARRSQVYAAAYEWSGGRCTETVQGDAYGLEELLAHVNGQGQKHVLYIGDGARAYRAGITAFIKSRPPDRDNGQAGTEGLFFHDEVGAFGLAEYILEIAEEKLKSGLTIRPAAFKPVYMRQAEAVRKLEESRRISGGYTQTQNAIVEEK